MAENDTQQDDFGLELALMDAIADEPIDQFTVEDPIDGDAYRMEGAEDLFGTNTDLDLDMSTFSQLLETAIDEASFEIEAAGADVDEVKEETFQEIVPEDFPGRQVFPVPTIREESLDDLFGEKRSLTLTALNQFRDRLRKHGYSAEEINAAANQYEVALTVGNGLAKSYNPMDREDLVDPTNVFIIGNNPIGVLKKVAYDAALLEIESADGFLDTLLAYAPGVSSTEVMKINDAIANGVVQVDAEFLQRVDEVKRKNKNLSEYEVVQKVNDEFIKAGKKDYMSMAPLSDVEQQQREEVGVFGSQTVQKYTGNTIAALAAFAAGKRAFATTFAAVPGPPQVKAGAGLLTGATAAFAASGMGKIGTDAVYNARFGTEDLDYDVPYLKTGKTVLGVWDVLKSMADATPYKTVEQFFTLNGPAMRAALTTGIVNTAVDLGLADKIAEMPSVKAFLESAAKGTALKEGTWQEYTQSLPGGTSMPLNWAIKIAYHPLIRSEMREAVERVGIDKDSSIWKFADFANESVLSMIGVDVDLDDEQEASQRRTSMIQDIVTEILGTDEFRRLANHERELAFGRMLEKSNEEIRLKALELNEDLFYKEYEKWIQNPDKYSIYDKKIAVESLINNSSWAIANEKWRGNQPSVKRVKEFVKYHYDNGYGDPDSSKYPEMYELFSLIKNEAADADIQAHLNAMPLGYVAQLNASNVDPVWKKPSFDEMIDFAKYVYDYKVKERGRKTTAVVQRGVQRATLDLINESGQGMLVEPNMWHKILQVGNYLDTAVDEIPITTPDLMVPLLESLNVPGGYLGTSAGLDRALKTGLRASMPHYWARVKGYSSQLLGGAGTGIEEVYTAAGYKRSDPEFAYSGLGHVIDFLPKESFAISTVGNTFRFARNLSRLSDNAIFKTANGKAANTLAMLEAMNGIRTSKSQDQVQLYFDTLVSIFREEIAYGRNPLRFLTADELDLFDSIFMTAGRNPDHGKVAIEKATNVANNVHGMLKSARKEIGDNDFLVLRASNGYKRLRADLDQLVRIGVLRPKYADQVLSMIEYQAIVASKMQGTKFGSAEDVLRNTRITYNKPPGAGINPTVRIVDADNNPLSSKYGALKGYFEYDQRTGRSIINFFQDGDIDSVWKMEGHFISHLLGDDFKNRVFRYFDHEYTDKGVIRLTDQGKKQFAAAWRLYRQTADNSNGYIRRLFDSLWLGLQEFWARLRRRPRVLPKELRAYWDLEFGALPSDIRQAQALASGSVFHRLRQIYESEDRAVGEAAAMRSRAAMVKDLGYDENVVRSLFGDRKTTVVRNVLDESTGQTKRVVEQSYPSRQYDAVEAAVRALAMIKTADFRKRFNLVGKNRRKYAIVGSGRYHVLQGILNDLTNRVNSRLNGAMGEAWTDTKKKLFQAGRGGKNVLNDPSTYPTNVTRQDVAAFADRMEALTGNRDGMAVATKQNFFVLDDRQQAGLKTLLQQIGNQPEADLLPIQLLDPYANLKILSNSEWEKIVQVLTDIEATPLNRRSRNTIQPRLSDYINDTLKRVGVTEAIGEWFSGFTKKFKKGRIEEYFPDGSYDPGAIDILRGGVRKWKNAGQELIDLSRTKDFAKLDTVGKFFKKYIDRSVSRINLAHLDDLKFLIEIFDGKSTDAPGIFAQLESKAAVDLAALNKSKATRGTVPRLDARVVDLDLQKIIQKIPSIQELLDGVYGMTGRERQAITVLRTVGIRLRRGEKLADFSEVEASIIADALQVVHAGLKTKEDYVLHIGTMLTERALAMKGIASADYGAAGMRTALYRTYKSWFTGDTDYLFNQPDIVTPVYRERVIPGFQETHVYGKSGVKVSADDISLAKEFREVFKRKVGTELPEANVRMISMLVFMKMDEIQQEVAEELAKYGYFSTKRDLVGSKKFRTDISIDRARYLDRVVFYLERALRMGDLIQLSKGKKPKFPDKPGVDAYGLTEQVPRQRKTTKAFNDLDLQAQFDAEQIMKRAGMRRAREEAKFVNIGDKQFLVPKHMFDFLQDEIEAKYNVRFQMDWGEGGSGEYFLRGRPENRVQRAISSSISAMARAASFIGPTGFYTGLLIGTGGIPMIGYGMGVFIGGLSQLHLGSGIRAVVRDAITGPLTLAETFAGTTIRGLAETDFRVPGTEKYVGLSEPTRAMLASYADSIQSRTSFTAGVLARLHGKDDAAPFTKPILMPDGRVFTADQIANSVRRYGWRSAMVDRFQDTKDINLFYERFSKSNPILMTTPMSALLGLSAGASVGMSAVFGLGLGYVLKPGNIFTKAHKFYREAFSAIDSFLRVKILMDELKQGKTLEEASIRVRDIALDYSNLSEAEKSMIGRYFAFYTYFSQAMRLFTQTLLENPQRVINQLKFIQKTQQERTENQLAQGDLPSWDAFRAFIPFEINGQYYRLPFLIGGDTAAIPIELFGALPFITSLGQDEDAQKELMKLIGRLSPAIQYGTEIMFDITPTTGKARSRSGFVVPYEMIELDRRVLGGALYDLLDIEHYAMSEIIKNEQDKTGKKRVSINKIDHPGRGVYVARNRRMYILLFDALQSPFTGRMGDNMLALSKANMGGFETMLDVAGDIQEHVTDGDPILSKVGPLIGLGLVKNKDAGSTLLVDEDDYVDPMDPDIGPVGFKELFRQNDQLSTARLELLIDQGKAFEKDGRIYVYTDQYYPAEAAKTIGMTLSPKINKQRNASARLRAQIARLKEIVGDEEQTPQDVME